MKWLVGIALIIASVSIVLPVLLRCSESARSDSRLDQIHESAAF